MDGRERVAIAMAFDIGRHFLRRSNRVREETQLIGFS